MPGSSSRTEGRQRGEHVRGLADRAEDPAGHLDLRARRGHHRRVVRRAGVEHQQALVAAVVGRAEGGVDVGLEPATHEQQLVSAERAEQVVQAAAEESVDPGSLEPGGRFGKACHAGRRGRHATTTPLVARREPASASTRHRSPRRSPTSGPIAARSHHHEAVRAGSRVPSWPGVRRRVGDCSGHDDPPTGPGCRRRLDEEVHGVVLGVVGTTVLDDDLAVLVLDRRR